MPTANDPNMHTLTARWIADNQWQNTLTAAQAYRAASRLVEAGHGDAIYVYATIDGNVYWRCGDRWIITSESRRNEVTILK